ncbi:MAG: hypothetical protein KF887_11100 [Paracoccaceae bacterium]|nr:MAG: hypothetical protein KF887_11100 [Paracoccaceae bacterium]
MGYQTGFHAPNGGANFLGYRRTRAGVLEVVFDDGVSRRMVWRVDEAHRVDEDRLADALSEAVGALRVVPALMAELKKRAIPVERIGG